MPGHFVSDGHDWKPGMIQRHENGKILVADAKNPKIMNAVVRELPDPDDPAKKIRMTKAQELGAVIQVQDPADPKRFLTAVEPDPAAVDTIRRMTGDDTAVTFQLTPPPEPAKPVVILNAAGDDARDVRMKEMEKRMAEQDALIKTLAGKGN